MRQVRERSIRLILQEVSDQDMLIMNDFLRAMAREMLARSTYNNGARFAGSILEAVAGDADYDVAGFVASTASKIEGWFGLDSYRQNLNENLSNRNRHHALICTEVRLSEKLWRLQENNERAFHLIMKRARKIAVAFARRLDIHDAAQIAVKSASDDEGKKTVARREAEKARRREQLETAARAWRHVSSKEVLARHVATELAGLTEDRRRQQLAGYLEMLDVVHGASSIAVLSCHYKGKSAGGSVTPTVVGSPFRRHSSCAACMRCRRTWRTTPPRGSTRRSKKCRSGVTPLHSCGCRRTSPTLGATTPVSARACTTFCWRTERGDALYQRTAQRRS